MGRLLRSCGIEALRLPVITNFLVRHPHRTKTVYESRTLINPFKNLPDAGDDSYLI